MQSTRFLLLFFCCFWTCWLESSAQLARYESVLSICGKTVYIADPQGSGDKRVKKMRVLMAIHGSGREAVSYKAGDSISVPFYVHQRDLALESGYLFVTISNGADTWGKEEGMQALLALHAYVIKTFNADTQWVLWASSAGGVLANRMVKEHPDKVRKIIGTFPVYDLSESFGHLASARKAWGNAEAARLANPALDPASLTSVPYLIFHGREDEAVPAHFHSEKLHREVNRAGGKVTLHLVNGGHSTTNFALYDDAIIKEFLLK
jgi:pimeloyl-ACP methyl ester carboxylesterase